jgi:trypsin
MMKHTVVLSALLSLVYARQEIVGGQVVPVGKHRYVAGLKDSDTATSKTQCGGSLIAPNVILTAAHCTGSWLQYAVVGTHKLTGFSDGELVKITKQIVHPKHNTKSLTNNVAVLLLDRNITSIQPVEISFERVGVDVLTWVRGWGAPNIDGYPTLELREVSVATWDNAKAAVAIGKSVDDTMLAAGGEKGKDACQYDYGGPMTIEHDGTVKLVGVVSWGYGCAYENKPGVYSRLDTSIDFIKPYLRDAC